MTIDPVTMVIWTYTDYKLFNYTIHQEDRYVRMIDDFDLYDVLLP